MNHTLATYEGHNLEFMLDENDELWFRLMRSDSNAYVTAVAFGPADRAIDKLGGIDEFIDNEVIPRANALLESFFGEVVPPEQGASWQEQLNFAIKNLKFDEATRTIKR